MKTLPPIATHELENLRKVCAELRVPVEAMAWLQSIVYGITLMESAPSAKSAPQRKNQLLEVAKLAQQLNIALQGLEYVDQAAIHQEFKGRQVRMKLDPPDPMREVFMRSSSDFEHTDMMATRSDVFCENVMLLGDVLLTLKVIAALAATRVTGAKKGGRPPALERRANHLIELARFAHVYGIEVGRGRDFVHLAEAVFYAAGVKVGPEPAIRKLTAELLPTLQAVWAMDEKNSDQQHNDQRLKPPPIH